MASEHAFDLEAEAEPIPDMTTVGGACSEAGEPAGGEMGGFMDDFDQGDDDVDTETGEINSLCMFP